MAKVLEFLSSEFGDSAGGIHLRVAVTQAEDRSANFSRRETSLRNENL